MFKSMLAKWEARAYKFYLITRVFSFITLLLSIAFYIYMIVTNQNHPFYFVAYIIFLAIAVFSGVVEIIYFRRKDEDSQTKKNKKKQYRKIKRWIRYPKYTVRLATIVVGIIELATFGGNNFKTTFFVITSYFFIQELIFNIVLEYFRYKIRQFKKRLSGKISSILGQNEEIEKIIDIDE